MNTHNFLDKFATAKDKVIVALDGIASLDEFKATVNRLAPLVGWFKIGTEMMLQYGAPTLIAIIKEAGAKVFCDLKLNDIPATCEKTAAKFKGVDMINIHCSAGEEAMKAVLSAVGPETIVIGVTVLTSFNDAMCQDVFGSGVEYKVLQLAEQAAQSGLHGIVCSAQDLKSYQLFWEIIKITPGIQPTWMQSNDQKRVMTPGEAIKAGATALVIGRAILTPPQIPTSGNSEIAAKLIISEILEAMNDMEIPISIH
jgi:orotidine-5'-phosphate decarboxylase